MTPRTPAEVLLEATLPPAHGHREGDATRAERLIAEAPDLTGADVWVAAATGNVEAVARFLAEDPSLARRDGGTRHWDPLLYLCFSRLLRSAPARRDVMFDAARRLLDAGADPNSHWIDPNEGDGNRETPIYGAAGVASHVELARLLVERGADPNDGETAYHMVEHDGVPCAGFIVPRLDPLQRAIALVHKLDYDDGRGLETLLELGIDPNAPGPFVNWPIHQAVFRARGVPFFELLRKYGADLALPNKEGRTAYAMAARSGHEEIRQWLEQAGAATDLPPLDAFIAACAAGQPEAARRIVAQHPQVRDGFSPGDWSEINEAAGAGRTHGVDTMLALGWDVNTRGRVWGETPAHRAAVEGRLETFALLVDRGADLTLLDRQYHGSPLSWASHGEKRDIVDFIRARGDRIDAWDAIELGLTDRVAALARTLDVNEGLRSCSPGVLLRLAAAHGHVEIAAVLLAHGGDPRLAADYGMNAIDVAREKGHEALAASLEAAG